MVVRRAEGGPLTENKYSCRCSLDFCWWLPERLGEGAFLVQRSAERTQDGNPSENSIALDIVNFIMLGIGYFYIPANIFELCFRIQSSCLETIWSFQVLLLWFIRGVQSNIQSRDNLHNWGKTFWNILLNAPWITSFPRVAYGSRTISVPRYTLRTFPLIFLNASLTFAGSLTHMMVLTHSSSYPANDSRRPLCGSQGLSLHAAFSCLVLFLMHILAVFISQLRESAELCLGSACLSYGLETLKEAWATVGLTVCSLYLWDHHLTLSAIHILKIFVFYSSSFLSCLRLEDISSPYY